MDPARWERAQAIFHEAVALRPPDRPAFIAQRCAGDDELGALVAQLVEADAGGRSVVDLEVAAVAQVVLDTGDPAASPTEVGRYVLRERLGEGGMGVVYAAERDDLGSRVAIKILRDAWVSPARRERFASEQRTLARLNHAAIARIFDAGTLGDLTPWFAMEYVEGEPLTAYCARTRATIAGRLRLFRQVCEAVGYAHQQLVVHRDLKPSNILVTNAGDVKLLDFGIAKQLETLDATADYTRTVLRLMTPAYAAPEQIRGEPCGLQTDVYTLGVLLYELLTGTGPFDLSSCTAVEAETMILGQDPPKPSDAHRARGADAPVGRVAWADLDVLTLTAMHKDPRRRYSSVDALVRDLDNFASGRPLDARPDSLGYRTQKFVSRHWQGLTAAAAVAALLVGLVAFYSARLSRALDAALEETARAERIQRFTLSLFDGGEAVAGPATDLRVVWLLDRGVQQAGSLEADPAIQAELYETLGSIYQRLGSHAEAETLLLRALEQRRTVLPPDHPDVMGSLVALGLLRLDQANLAEAETLAREAVAIARRALPAGHPGLPKAVAALGKVLREQGEYDEATPHFEEAIALYSTSDAWAAELAATMTALANTHYYAGRLDASERLNQQVIVMDRRIYGPRHPSVAHDLLNLGAIEAARARQSEAASLYQQALDILEPWYGPDHPETASAKTILAQAYSRIDREEEAIALLREALAAQEHNYGDVHPRVALILNEMALIAMRRDELGDARRSFEQALRIYTEIYDGRHARVGIAMANLASVHLAAGDFDTAERLFRRALDVYGEILPETHMNIGIARSKLGRTLLRQGRHREAEEQLVAAHDVLAEQAGGGVWLAPTREDLAAVYDALEQPERAERFRAAAS